MAPSTGSRRPASHPPIGSVHPFPLPSVHTRVPTQMQRTILPVERPLVAAKLEAVEAALRCGLEELTWQAAAEADAYIAEAGELVSAGMRMRKGLGAGTNMFACACRRLPLMPSPRLPPPHPCPSPLPVRCATWTRCWA